MVTIEVRCPVCFKKGNIDVPKEVLQSISRGLLSVNVSKICSHSFIAYIDKNLKIRDYFMVDFHIEIPESITIDKSEIKKIPGPDLINLDLIKLNFTPTLITYVIKSIFLRKKIAIISGDTFLNDHFTNFFDFLTKSTYNNEIFYITEDEYKNNKIKFKDFVVFKGNTLIQNPNKTIVPKKLKVERKIIQKFFSESELTYSLIFLKNEIQKSYTLAKTIAKFVKRLKKGEKINIINIINHLEEVHNIKVESPYLDFLIEIVKNYFEIEAPIIYDSFLKFL